MTLYLKYRPQKIDELDLESVRNSLSQILKSSQIPHAFLFSGPKGTGKTSAARILAKVLNCQNLTKKGEPCNKCDSCLAIMKGNHIDVIELDAASNRGIDDIRSLKEGIFLSPVAGKKKVYIIDEAHMLTLEAANAFLKTLEEPPDHVIFVLATTNPEKLPETVISRLTKINFTRASDKDISRQLTRVASSEKIKIDKVALEKIAKLADGSFRDAVKILEELTFTTKHVKASDIPDSHATNFFDVLKKKDVKEILIFIENEIEKGVAIKNLTSNILADLHTSLLAKNGLGDDTLPDFSSDNLLTLISLLEIARRETFPSIPQLSLEIALAKFLKFDQKITHQDPPKKKVDETLVQKEKPKIKLDGKPLDATVWQKLLENIRGKNVSIEALLRAAKPLDFDGKVLHLGVYYQFHKDRLEDIKNSQILEAVCISTLALSSIKISYQLIERDKKALQEEHLPTPQNEVKPRVVSEVEPLTTSADNDILEAAKEIFG